MKTASHKTEAIYRRYAIADESMLREGAANLEALLHAQRDLTRMVVPQRPGKITAKSAGRNGVVEPVSAAELGARIETEMVGWDGIEPPTPGFSVGRAGPDHAMPSSGIVDNQADSEG